MRPLLPSAVLLIALVGCSNILGFDREEPASGRSVVSGTVTSAVDGSPIEGAKVYWGPNTGGGLFVRRGTRLVVDTAVADAAGFYRLDTEYYCASQLVAQADGHVSAAGINFFYCPDIGPLVANIVLSPLEPGGGGL